MKTIKIKKKNKNKFYLNIKNFLVYSKLINNIFFIILII